MTRRHNSKDLYLREHHSANLQSLKVYLTWHKKYLYEIYQNFLHSSELTLRLLWLTSAAERVQLSLLASSSHPPAMQQITIIAYSTSVELISNSELFNMETASEPMRLNWASRDCCAEYNLTTLSVVKVVYSVRNTRVSDFGALMG